jgi:hypothetical protein
MAAGPENDFVGPWATYTVAPVIVNKITNFRYLKSVYSASTT